ncbi:hypothetical protein PLICRDRAFT_44380 [Plicaturopsis crispa FD-325 SS-3]|nr:hypothetical protein PLICRDRAFT_44380 [Plicaturopsis crispa FD-325 SS-3]
MQSDEDYAHADSAVPDADAPFNDPKADVILRSSDNIDFRAFKFLLSMASSFFEGMFTLPQSQGPAKSGEGAGEVVKDGLPVIPMSEDSLTVKNLLLFCLPTATVDRPKLETVKEILAVLDAALKYEMAHVQRHARAALVCPDIFASEAPLRIFAIAVQYNLEEEARVAARHILAVPIAEWPFVEEMRYLTACQYHRLLEYNRQCVNAAVTRGMNVQDDITYRPETCPAKAGMCYYHTRSLSYSMSYRNRVDDAPWWEDLMSEVTAALKLRPCGAALGQSFIVESATLARAWKCTHCGPKMHTHMKNIIAYISREVEKVVSEIKLKIES